MNEKAFESMARKALMCGNLCELECVPPQTLGQVATVLKSAFNSGLEEGAIICEEIMASDTYYHPERVIRERKIP